MNDVGVLDILFFATVFAMIGLCLFVLVWMAIDEYRLHAWMKRVEQKLERCDD